MKALVSAMTNGNLAKLSIAVLGSLVILGITGAFLVWGELRSVVDTVKDHNERILYLERQARAPDRAP